MKEDEMDQPCGTQRETKARTTFSLKPADLSGYLNFSSLKYPK